MNQISTQNMIQILETLNKSTVVNFKNSKYHLNLGDNSKKAYILSASSNNIYFPFSQSLQTELDKQDIANVDFQIVQHYTTKLTQGVIDILNGELFISEKMLYTQADFIRLHKLKHEFDKKIIFFGPSEMQEKKIHEDALKDIESFEDVVSDSYMDTITNNLKKVIKPNSVVDMPISQFKHLLQSYLVN